MFRTYSILVLGGSLLVAAAAEGAPVTTLQEAEALFKERHAAHQVGRLQAEGLAALAEQEGKVPNPELFFSSENIRFEDEAFGVAEHTIGVSQLVETGGKRGLRREVAEQERSQAALRTEGEVRELLGELRKAFARVLHAQRQIALAEEQRTLFGQVSRAAQAKADAGGALPAEAAKARLAVETVELEIARARAELQANKRTLSAFWNGDESDVGVVEEMSRAELPDADPEESPAVRLAQGEAELSERMALLERAKADPDVTVEVGYRRLEEDEDNALVAQLSMPLPFFSRNEGAIRNAENNLSAARLKSEQSAVQARSAIANLRAKRGLLESSRERLRKSLLPRAQSVFRETLEAYQLGRSSYLDLLDAARTVSETQKQSFELELESAETESELYALLGD